MTQHYSVRLRAFALALVTFVIASTSLMAQWSTLPELPEARRWSAQAVVGGKLYVFGGMDASGRPQTEAWVLDLTNVEAGWSAVADMPDDRGGAYATAVDGKIYLVGGVGVTTAVEPRGTVLEYDPTANTYTPKASMPTPTWFGAGATLGTKVYYAGGLARVGTSNTPVNPTQVYDIATNTWSAGAALPQAYYYGQAAAVGSDVYFFGGRTSTTLNGGVIKMAGGTGSWTNVSGAVMNTPVYDASVGVLNNKIYVAGGTGTAADTKVSQIYDPAANSWTVSYPLPAANAAAGSLASDGSALYMISGTANQTLKLSVGVDAAVAVVSPTSINIAAKAGASNSKLFSIENLGVIALTGTVEVAAGAPWLSVSNTSVNIAAGANDQFELTADASSLAVGVYTATVEVKTNDTENPTIPVSVKLFVVETLVEQPTNAVLEEATGNWCPPCGAYGTPEVRRLTNVFGERLITIAYHDRGGRPTEPMATTQTEAMTARLGVPYWPAAAVQRIDWPEEDGLMTGTTTWESHIQTVLNTTPIAPAALEVIEYAYNPSTKRVTAKVKISTADAIDMAGSTLRLTAVVMEDSLEYTQAGTTESPYYHMHVARSFWPNIEGQTVTLPSGSTDSGVLLPGKEIIVDAAWTVTGVVRPEISHVVFILAVNQGTQPGVILQGQEMALMGESTPGSPLIAVTQDAAQKSITVGATATFNSMVTNLSDNPLEVSVDRVSNTMPAEWTSQLCVGDDCSATTANKVTTTIAPGQSVTFKVKVLGGSASSQGVVGIRISAGDTVVNQTYTAVTGASGVEIETGSNGVLAMSAYPNPTSSATRVEFTMPNSGNATLELFASNGTKVATLLDGRRDAGRQSATIDLATVPAGVYTMTLTVGDRVSTRTITVVR